MRVALGKRAPTCGVSLSAKGDNAACGSSVLGDAGEQAAREHGGKEDWAAAHGPVWSYAGCLGRAEREKEEG